MGKTSVIRLAVAAFVAVCGTASFAEGLKQQPLKPVPIQQVKVDDEFWSPKRKVWRDVTIPDCLAKFEKDGTLKNFDRVRDGETGNHGGLPWFDGLIYEMIRGSADFIASEPNPALEARLDGYITQIAAAAAKDPDGYVNTFTQLKEPNHRWGLNGGDDKWLHDVYNASAMVEAAVHYYRATGKTKLLQVAVKLANHMVGVMGPAPKKNIIPGHALGEEALVKLHLLFKEQPQLKAKMGVPVLEDQYLKLTEFWIENRGHHEGRKDYGSYNQDHQPVLEQKTIEGHAVRATLLCAGVSAAGVVNGREDYMSAAQRLWDNMVYRKMYVIGGLGSIAGHEGFGPDYVLPNNGYLETCAAIGAGFFHENMNLAFADAKYADELERVLYNGVLSGVSIKGDSYFYENPLEAGANRKRWAWHDCPCCPPMFAKIMGALPEFIYAQSDRDLYVNLFIGNRAAVTLNKVKVGLRETTRYPWNGQVRLEVDPEQKAAFTVHVRLPGWCEKPSLALNSKPLEKMEIVNGYAVLNREWQKGDVVELTLPMTVERVKGNPKIEADAGRLAIQRGPLVYCLEAVDNDGHLSDLIIPADAQLVAEHRPEFLGGVTVIRGSALIQASWKDALYVASNPASQKNIEFTAIPYYANANRQPGEMMVWLPETGISKHAENKPQAKLQ